MNGKRKCSVCVYIFFVAVQLLSHIQLFMIPWTAARQACLSPSPRVCPSLCSLHQWCHPAISSSDALFSCPRSFPALGTSPVSHLFTSDDQSTGASASASVLPVNNQGWSPLTLTDLISLLSKGLSGIFSGTTVRRHQFFGILPSLESSSHNCTWPLVPIALAIRTFVGRVMSLLTNTLFRFVIAFLPRSNRLLIHGCSHHPQWF